MDLLLTWPLAFVASDAVQLALVVPRMLACPSSHKLVILSYALSVLGDGWWHVGREEDSTSITVASVFFLIGTLPLVYRFFVVGGADGKTKAAMGALYALNLYTFGDPNDTAAPRFLEKHLANHVGSTVFLYLAATVEYQETEPKTKKKS